MKEKPEPENPGEKIARIEKQEITGMNVHQQKMLRKYIKADSLEAVEKLTDKYEYFR